MKKFDIKKLLILILALILVVALAACNNKKKGSDDDDDDQIQGDGKITAAQFFNDLFKTGNTIGNKDEVDATKDMALELSASVLIDTGKGATGATLPIDLNIKAFIDVDGGMADSAVMIDAQIKFLTLKLYYFLNDSENVYLSSNLSADEDEIYRIPLVLNPGADPGQSAVWSSAVAGFLGIDENGDPIEGKLWENINAITDDFGEDYTLDLTLNKLLAILGLDLDKILDDLKAGPVGALLGSLKIEKDETAGIYKLLDILVAVDKVLSFGKASPVAGGKGYELNLANSGGLKAILPGVLGGEAILGGALKEVVTSAKFPDVIVGYTKTEAGDFDSLYLKLVLNSTTNRFAVTVTLDDIKVYNTSSSQDAYKLFDVDEDDCSDDAAIANLSFGTNTQISIAQNMFKLTYDPMDNTDTYRTSAGGDTAWDTWAIIGTEYPDGYCIAPSVDALDLDGVYKITGGKFSPSLDGNNSIIQGKIAIQGTDESIEINFVPGEDDMADFKVIVTTKDTDGRALIGFKYIAQLLGTMLVDDIKVLNSDYSFNNKIIAALQAIEAVVPVLEDGVKTYVYDMDNILWDSGLITDVYATEIGDWYSFIVQAVMDAADGHAGCEEATHNIYYLNYNGALIFTDTAACGSEYVYATQANKKAELDNKKVADPAVPAVFAFDDTYEFVGWDGVESWTPEGGTTIKHGIQKVEGDIILKAKFKADSKADLNFNNLFNQIIACLSNDGNDGDGLKLNVANIKTLVEAVAGDEIYDGLHEETIDFVAALLDGSVADSVEELLAAKAIIVWNKDKLEITYEKGGKQIVITASIVLSARPN